MNTSPLLRPVFRWFLLSTAIFAGLSFIFAADLIREAQRDLEVFGARLAVHAALGASTAALALWLASRRKERWRIEADGVFLEHWGALTGWHHVRALHVRAGSYGEEILLVELSTGEMVVLKVGPPAAVEAQGRILEEAWKLRLLRASDGSAA